MTFFTFPATFEREIAKGFNKRQVAHVLKEAGILTPSADGRGYQRKTPRIDGRQITVYVLQFMAEEDSQPEE